MFPKLTELVLKGVLSETLIDKACQRILRGKIWLGLFESPFADPQKAESITNCEAHKQLALEAAQKSIVLLKNNGILPLSKNIGSIAVIGPNANATRLGGYSTFDKKAVTVLEGIKNKVSKKTKLFFAEGCKVNSLSKQGFSKAISVASKADVAILVMGNSEEVEGESRDRCNLNLLGVQEDLIKAIVNTGTPVVIVLLNGSAITMTNWISDVDAVIEAWYPGEQGGNAIANVIFGDYNPSGKLPITFPRFTGQCPLYYNHLPCVRSLDYVEARGRQPLFPFGYGLSYSNFIYSNLKLSSETFPKNGEITITIDVENASQFPGEEIVQLYIRDIVSSIVRPVRELKRFIKVPLKPGEKKKIGFTLTEDDISFLDEKLHRIVEPGLFEVFVGKNCLDGLRGTFMFK